MMRRVASLALKIGTFNSMILKEAKSNYQYFICLKHSLEQVRGDINRCAELLTGLDLTLKVLEKEKKGWQMCSNCELKCTKRNCLHWHSWKPKF